MPKTIHFWTMAWFLRHVWAIAYVLHRTFREHLLPHLDTENEIK